MKKPTRRRFFKTAAASGVAAMLGSQALAFANEKVFMHQVYFWLKNPDSEEDKEKLIEGLKRLTKVKIIRKHFIGLPSVADRGVIDSTYSVSWLLFFKSKADEASYQKDPIHLKFVEECSPLWDKVLVYDSQEI